MPKSDFWCGRNTFFFRKSPLCTCSLFANTQKKCTDIDLVLFYILLLGVWSNLPREKKILALGVRFPQPCSSAGHRFAATGPRLHYYTTNCFASTRWIQWNALYTGFHWESAFVREIPHPPEGCAVYGCWPLISSKPGSSPPERPGLDNIPNRLIERKPPPPGGFPICYAPSLARTVSKRTPLKHLVQIPRGGPLTHGSWWGNIVNRKPLPGGGGFRSKYFVPDQKKFKFEDWSPRF